MDKIVSFKRYICGYEDIDFSSMYRLCKKGARRMPVNVFLTEHKKQGTVLINTGCSRLLKHNRAAFAKLLTKHRLSFSNDDDITKRLIDEKMDPVCVRKVLLTHTDPECCGGLPLLPRYELISTPRVLSLLATGDPGSGIMKSTLPPASVPRRAPGIFQGKTFLKNYFKWVFDVFGDGSILAVDISGHSQAMAGFYFPEKKIFVLGDASIDITALEENLIPSEKLLSRQAYPDDYLSVLITLKKLHREHPEIRMIFSHSEEINN